MDNRTRLLELQQSWTPPDGLDRSRPRQVLLTGAGKAVRALAVTLLVAALASAIALGMVARREADAQRRLRDEGLDTEARITRLWRSRNDDRQPWVAYRFTAQERVYERRMKVPLRVWRQLKPESGLTVRYLPSNPLLNHPHAWRQNTMPAFLPYLVAAVLAALGALAAQVIRRQRWLLAHGRAAPALVTRYSQAKEGKTFHYVFPLLSGAVREGRGGATKKPPALGTTLCVLYHPDHPRHNAPYPLSLVKPARR